MKGIIIFDKKKNLKQSDLTEKLENGDVIYFPPSQIDFVNEKLLATLTDKPTVSVVNLLGNQIKIFLQTFIIPYNEGMTQLQGKFWVEKRPSKPIPILQSDVLKNGISNGKRILRFFIKFPTKSPSFWVHGSSFEHAVQYFSKHRSLFKPAPLLKRWFHKLFKQPFSSYDFFLSRLQNLIKNDAAFQKQIDKQEMKIEPYAAILAFTDHHCYDLVGKDNVYEQTFLIHRHSLLNPEVAPASFLQRLMDQNPVDPEYVIL